MRRLAETETKERVRLQAVLYEAAALARLPWPVEQTISRSAEWSITRELLPAWVQARSHSADAFFSSDGDALRRFFSHALPAPVAEPPLRLIARHPLRVVSRLAVGAALVTHYAALQPLKRSARAALREIVRRSDNLYGQLRAFKALARTRKPKALPPEAAAILNDNPALRRFVDEVRRAHFLPMTAAARRKRVSAALERLMAGPFLRDFVNTQLARAAHDEPLGRLNEYERRLPLFRIPGFALSIAFINVERASREIASTASDAWMAPLHDGVRIVRYKVPDVLLRGLFSRGAKLQQLKTEPLSARRPTALLRTDQAYSIESNAGEVAAMVFEATQRDPLIWRFDPKTLGCIGVMPSDVKITRIKETLRFIEAMKLHEAAPYVQSIAQHSSHFLRWSAISTLYKLQSPAALPLLRRATRDRHPHVRRAASALLLERSRNGVNA
ncbi:MAG: HEAT repeat domain-containing protein [Candidatus Eremiobacteraeota bacterium]|nr:HEAT repeat domain-containing protein [Candidatus Eremiobacteraeota bacterium]